MEPLVSISCITYNHAPYKKQCLDGFLMQKTTFSFEVLIHDDASTDGTTEIIKDYAQKYPEIIKPLYEEENQWIKGRRGSSEFNFPRARGKYIALCEGDDYWIDEIKLQMQVDFLENNPEYTMCFHSAIQHYENNEIQDAPFSIITDRDYSSIEIFKRWIIPTASVVYKRFIVDTDLYKSMKSDKRLIFGDTPLFLACSEAGKIRGFSKHMSVYRRHENGTVWRVSLDRNYKHYFHNLVISDNIPKLKQSVLFANKKLVAYSCLMAFEKKEYSLLRKLFVLDIVACIVFCPLYFVKFKILKRK